MADYRRARWGLRRTFQTEQAIERAVGLRQRGDDPRALRRERPRDRRGDADARSSSSGSTTRAERQGRRRSVPASGGWSRWPAPSSASRGSCCSTSRPPGCLTDETAAPRRGDPADPRAHRARRDPRRPRHEPGLGVLRDDRRARLRQADRVGARRARCCGTSAWSTRTSARRTELVTSTAVAAAIAATRRLCRCPVDPRTSSRCLPADPARGGDDAARPERSRQVDARARGRAACLRPSDGRGAARRPGSDEPLGPSGSGQAGVAVVPEGGAPAAGADDRRQPPSRDLRARARGGRRRASLCALELFPRARSDAGTRPARLALGRRAADARARPGTRLTAERPARRRALARPGAGRRASASCRRSEAVAAAGAGVLLIEQFAHVAPLAGQHRLRARRNGRIRYEGTAEDAQEAPRDVLQTAYLTGDERGGVDADWRRVRTTTCP